MYMKFVLRFLYCKRVWKYSRGYSCCQASSLSISVCYLVLTLLCVLKVQEPPIGQIFVKICIWDIFCENYWPHIN